MEYEKNHVNTSELRRVQSIHGETSFVLVLPKDFVRELKIAKGDYLKCRIVNDELVIKKADL